jgi:hypothetical protein
VCDVRQIAPGFPSLQRGPRDEHAKSFRESLKIARAAAGLHWVGFHDFAALFLFRVRDGRN